MGKTSTYRGETLAALNDAGVARVASLKLGGSGKDWESHSGESSSTSEFHG